MICATSMLMSSFFPMMSSCAKKTFYREVGCCRIWVIEQCRCSLSLMVALGETATSISYIFSFCLSLSVLFVGVSFLVLVKTSYLMQLSSFFQTKQWIGDSRKVERERTWEQSRMKEPHIRARVFETFPNMCSPHYLSAAAHSAGMQASKHMSIT